MRGFYNSWKLTPNKRFNTSCGVYYCRLYQHRGNAETVLRQALRRLDSLTREAQQPPESTAKVMMNRTRAEPSVIEVMINSDIAHWQMLPRLPRLAKRPMIEGEHEDPIEEGERKLVIDVRSQDPTDYREGWPCCRSCAVYPGPYSGWWA